MNRQSPKAIMQRVELKFELYVAMPFNTCLALCICACVYAKAIVPTNRFYYYQLKFLRAFARRRRRSIVCLLHSSVYLYYLLHFLPSFLSAYERIVECSLCRDIQYDVCPLIFYMNCYALTIFGVCERVDVYRTVIFRSLFYDVVSLSLSICTFLDKIKYNRNE